jgi:hypothetical protein
MFCDAMLGLEVQQEALHSKPSSPTNLLPQGRWDLRAGTSGAFGSKPYLGHVIRRLAFCSNPPQFESEASGCGRELVTLMRVGKITRKQPEPLFNLFG